MCFFSVKAPKQTPLAQPPQASPMALDQTAFDDRTRLRNRLRQAFTRQDTILAGNSLSGNVAAPTAPPKTLLGG